MLVHGGFFIEDAGHDGGESWEKSKRRKKRLVASASCETFFAGSTQSTSPVTADGVVITNARSEENITLAVIWHAWAAILTFWAPRVFDVACDALKNSFRRGV